VSVDWDRAGESVRALRDAVSVKHALMDMGLPAYLLSLDQGLPHLLATPRQAVVFPVVEDLDASPTALREALTRAGLPFVGNPAHIVRAATDKHNAKRLLAARDLPVPRGILVSPPVHRRKVADFARSVGMPVVIKPRVGIGGSIGVCIASTADELDAELDGLRGEVLVEAYVPGDEYTVWVFGERPWPEALVILTVDRGGRPILCRESKVVGVPKTIDNVVAPVRDDLAQRIRDIAARAHVAVGASTYSRVDLIVDGEVPVVLEVNTAPRVAANATYGVDVGQAFSFEEFVHQQVVLAWERRPGPRSA
jgi:D-alanine-D-alanine ligase